MYDLSLLITGILALAATQQYFLLSEVSNRILPALCPLALDPDKSVRDALFRTIKGFLGKLEKVSEDPTLRESMGNDNFHDDMFSSLSYPSRVLITLLLCGCTTCLLSMCLMILVK